MAPQDLELYDRLVLHREREAHQSWHGGVGLPHPQDHFNYTAPMSHDAGQTIPSMVGPLFTLSVLCGAMPAILAFLTLSLYLAQQHTVSTQRARLKFALVS